MKRMLFLFAVAIVLSFSMPGSASAQSCTAVATDLNFGSVSPISRTAFAATSTVSVTCTWPSVTLVPNAQICLNLGGTSPRQLANGTNTMQYDLYQDAGHSVIWGSTYTGTTPISFVMSKPALSTTLTQAVTVYGQISANQPTVPTAGNASTLYTQGFGGAQTSLNVGFYLLGTGLPCSTLATSGTFGFSANATVVNNCNISATNIAFTPAALLTSALTASGAITAQCTNGDAYKITLDGGVNGTVAARNMLRPGGAKIGYQLYTDQQFATPWGDGSAGTSTVTRTGTGLAQVITVYGRVPAQTTPAPGTYTDTITATISF
ncbi:Csu type fimbrial protein [Burkholderia sp. Leaf177]|uniref:Csu type fimbrial protein n=1 Tax=Burkholderia sp. Leaf177 TaxID=1736287 RepID=UPI0009E77B7E|nr:spore coat protein U domain-containing protein [Burkholderia sp. Leaf177]